MSTPLGRGFWDRALEASVVGSFSRLGPTFRRREQHWAPLGSMSGRTVLITGATSGLGLAGAKRLHALGARVVAVGRNNDVLSSLERELGERLLAWRVDLGDLRAVGGLADRLNELDRLDVVIHNAGALLASRTETAQGVETTLAVHLLAPYLLTQQLGTGTEHSRRRVIFMTSGGAYTQGLDLNTLETPLEGYRGSVAYARVKRAQIVLVAALQSREPAQGRLFYAVHPGWAATPGVSAGLPTFDRLTRPLLRTPDEGVDGALWLASVEPPPSGGGLWLDREPRPAYRLKRTKPADESLEQVQLLEWIDQRITRALS